jgi:3-phosphoshikimate 1-carboxyvinyltransferase
MATLTVRPTHAERPLAVRRTLVIDLPSDKSMTHRYLIFAAMATGISRIRGVTLGEDCKATLDCLSQLGVTFTVGPSTNSLGHSSKSDDSSQFLSLSLLSENDVDITVDSKGFRQWTQPVLSLDAKNSGTTARLLLGLLASRPGLRFSLFGDDSLSQRPMDRIVKPLAQIGAYLSSTKLPIEGTGVQIPNFEIATSIASAQVKSALILAALSASGPVGSVSTITAPSGTRAHTEEILKDLGIDIRWTKENDIDKFIVPCIADLRPFDTYVPRDPSSFAFFAIFAALWPGLTLHSQFILDVQDRLDYLTHLKKAGLRVEIKPTPTKNVVGASVAAIEVSASAPLAAITMNAHQTRASIDEICALSAIAAVSQGDSSWKSLGELRIKESDRLDAIVKLMTTAGIHVKVSGDDLIIRGQEKVSSFKMRSLDHRVVMAASLLATRAHGPCDIDGIESCAVSMPGFDRVLKALAQQCGIAHIELS